MTAVSGDITANAGLLKPAVTMRGGVADLSPRTPVHVEIDRLRSVRTIRIAVVVPCYNRRADAEAVLEDLARVELAGAAWTIDLRVLLVDNASDEPLSSVTGSWSSKQAGSGGLRLEHLRSPTNSGGSGGYNLGMARVLAWWTDAESEGLDAQDPECAWDPEYVWLVDSDARVAPTTLSRLLEVMERDDSIVGAGSVICDPLTGQAFELGGNQNIRTGHFEPMVLGGVGVVGGEDGLVDCDYVAACCALVRADAIRATGLFPDRFLNADDVEWFIRMKQRTGGRVVGVPGSLAMHPRFDRFPTWTRYYMCRNSMGPLEAVGGGAYSRLVRATREVLRAVQQAIMGRTDLAGLHVRGLKDAADHSTIGAAPAGVIALAATSAWPRLSEDLKRELGPRHSVASAWVLNDLAIGPVAEREMREQLEAIGAEQRWQTPKRERGVAASVLGAAGRWLFGPRADIAVVPARGRPSAWFSGRVMVQGTPQGYVIRRFGRLRPLIDAAKTLSMGGWHGLRCTFRKPEHVILPAAPAGPTSGRPQDVPGDESQRLSNPPHVPIPPFSLTVVVLSYNRLAALRATLTSLLADPTVQAAGGPAAIIVADNASTDGTPASIASEFAGVRVMAMDVNLGVQAFNLAVESCASDLVLVLDDDATVAHRALAGAVELMARRPGLGAVTFLPRHPRTGRAEWSFGERDDTGRWTSEQWPVMGCANLVRRSDWQAAGGYEREYFLYRNDTDLALKLLSMSRGVYFDSSWVAMHDTASGAGSRKGARWHRLATRNWVWMCRRHGRGATAAAAAAAGWAWGHVLAGLSIHRQWETFRGGIEGIARPAPALSLPVKPDGRALQRLLALRSEAKRHRRA